MHNFEAMIIMPPDLEDNVYYGIFSDIEQFINLNGGKVNKIDNWGKKYLAYEINGSYLGNYALITFEYPVNDVSPVYNFLHNHDKILRSMVITKFD